MPRKNDVNVDIKVDDKGSLKKVGTSAHSADRRLKGAAQASSNASKNFSKMAQGISGGLVPAYATLAASLFAVDAVFRALKEAADMRVLLQGQQAFAASTGIAMTSVAKSVQAATEAQISFKEASQATAIGFAAGLSAEQMERLGAAATSAAKVLGRDTADAFDRLTRGVIKAEPEVLDELGIILRLDEATRKYAETLGINANNLTTYQKSQAVLNEVLEQAETKYEDVAASIQPNTYQQLAVAFTQVKETIQAIVSPALEVVANFLAGNVVAAGAVALLFFGSILKGLTPTTEEVAANAVSRFKSVEQAIRDAKNEVVALKAEQEGMTERSGMAMGGAGKIARQAGVTDRRTTAGKLASGQVISAKQAKAEILRIEKSKNGKIHGMTKKQTAAYKRELKKIVKETQTGTQKQAGMFKQMSLKWKITLNEMKMKHKDTWLAMTNITNAASKAMAFAMKATGYIGIFMLVIQLLISAGKAIKNFFFPPTAESTKLKEMLDEVTGATSGINKEFTRMNLKLGDTRETWNSQAAAISYFSNAFQSIPFKKLGETVDMLESMGESVDDDLQDEVKALAENLNDMGFSFLKLNDPSSPTSIKQFLKNAQLTRDALSELNSASLQVTEGIKKLTTAEKKRTDAFKFANKDEILALESIIEGLKIRQMVTEEESDALKKYQDKLNDILNIEIRIAEVKQRQTELMLEQALAVDVLSKKQKHLFKIEERRLKAELLATKIAEQDRIGQEYGEGSSMRARSDLAKTDLEIQQQVLVVQNKIDELLNSFEFKMELSVYNATYKGLAKGFEDVFSGKGDLGDLVSGVLSSVAAAMAKSMAEETTNMIMSSGTMGGLFSKVTGKEKPEGLQGELDKLKELELKKQADIMALQEVTTTAMDKFKTSLDEASISINDFAGKLKAAFLGEGGGEGEEGGAFSAFKSWASSLSTSALPGASPFSKGGTVKGYASGGIVRGYDSGGKVPGTYAGRDTVPAMLSPGEFVFTPKQLKAITGGSTVVNVDMGGSITSQQSDAAEAKAFGQAIALAVNKEISKQKRIGGSLYTYGGGGI